MSKMRVVAVGEFPLISGFALAGIPVVEAESRDEAAARLADLVNHDDVGVVFADHAVVDALPEPIRRRLSRQSTPVLLSLPDPDWSAAVETQSNEILDLLQRAIGYRVRLQ
jgi:vacuolar-type H+-ATPase subunit F/Vma7